jgi:hypothetical protein
MASALGALALQAPKPNVFRRFTGKVSQTAKSAMEKTGVSKALGKASKKFSQAKRRVVTHWDPVAQQQRLQESIAKKMSQAEIQGQILAAKAAQATKDLAARQEFAAAKAAIMQQAQAAKAARKATQAATVSVPKALPFEVPHVGGARKRTRKHNNKKKTHKKFKSKSKSKFRKHRK